MVVIATPSPYPQVPYPDPQVSNGQLNPVPCATQNVVSAPISTVNGTPVYSRMRAISFTQGQCGFIDWQLHDRDGPDAALSGVAVLFDGGGCRSAVAFNIICETIRALVLTLRRNMHLT